MATAPSRTIDTGRLVMAPVCPSDLGELCAFKADPRIYAGMLGGLMSPAQVAAELDADMAFWAAQGVGIWTVRDRTGALVGLTGMHQRPDGRGIALRLAFRPETQGKGIAREAAGAALRFAHDQAHIPRVVAISREDNVGSRAVLGAIGMRECERFMRGGTPMVTLESLSASESKMTEGEVFTP